MTEPSWVAKLQAKKDAANIPIPGWEFVGWVHEGYLHISPPLSANAIPVYRQADNES